MTYAHVPVGRAAAARPVETTLLSFPIACFSLTVLTDVAYVLTENLLWLHFSEWLLLAGLVFAVAGAIAFLINSFDWFRYVWPSFLGGIAVMVLATINSFIHTADGWTAVVPYGLILSVVTVVAMLVTAWLATRSVRHD